jgi:uncharacterized membrane protein (DUF485 family)
VILLDPIKEKYKACRERMALRRKIRSLQVSVAVLAMFLVIHFAYDIVASTKQKEVSAKVVPIVAQQPAEEKVQPVVVNNIVKKYYVCKCEQEKKAEEVKVIITTPPEVADGVIVTVPQVEEKVEATPLPAPTPEPSPTPTIKYWPNGDEIWDPYPGVYDSQGNRI